MIRYSIPIYTKLEETLPSFQDLVSEVNKTMQSFGFDERISIEAPIMHFEITLLKQPNPKQIAEILMVLQECFDTTLEFKCRIGNYHEWEIV